MTVIARLTCRNWVISDAFFEKNTFNCLQKIHKSSGYHPMVPKRFWGIATTHLVVFLRLKCEYILVIVNKYYEQKMKFLTET